MQAQRLRRILTAKVDALFETCDVLLTAVIPGPAPVLEETDQRPWREPQPITSVFNVTGHPASRSPAASRRTACRCRCSSSAAPFDEATRAAGRPCLRASGGLGRQAPGAGRAMTDRQGDAIARNVRRVAHLDLMGAGQVTVAGNHAYIGHITNKEGLGTTILDVSDPANPRVVSTIMLDDPGSHSHKARVAGDLMIVNSERNNSGIGRKAEALPGTRAHLRELLGREPSHVELAEKLGVEPGDIPLLEEAEQHPYDRGGFKLYDVSDKARPREIAFQRTGGIGVHRFDMDADYAYISTEMAGFVGNILVIYDIRNPQDVTEVSRWWLPGQHIAGGETPSWPGRQHRLHHALRFGSEMWAGCWHGGLRVIDVSDIARPKTLAAYNYHPPFPEPTHTVMPLPFRPGGRRIALAIDEEDQFYGAAEAEARGAGRTRRYGRLRQRLGASASRWRCSRSAKSIYPTAAPPAAALARTSSMSACTTASSIAPGSAAVCGWSMSPIPSIPREIAYVHPRAMRRPSEPAIERCRNRRPRSDLPRRPQYRPRHPRIAAVTERGHPALMRQVPRSQSPAQLPPRQQNVPAVTVKAPNKDEFIHRPADRFDRPRGDVAFVVQQRQMRGETPCAPTPEPAFPQRRNELVPQHPDPGKALVSNKDQWPLRLAVKAFCPVEGDLEAPHRDGRGGCAGRRHRLVRQLPVVADTEQRDMKAALPERLAAQSEAISRRCEESSSAPCGVQRRAGGQKTRHHADRTCCRRDRATRWNSRSRELPGAGGHRQG